MRELEKAQFMIVHPFMNDINFETAYLYSIVENRQDGRIFVDNIESPRTVLLWHYCGFAYVIGNTANDNFNRDIVKLLSGEFEDNQRRFVLHMNDKIWNEKIIKITENNFDINQTQRYIFRFNRERYKIQDYSVSNTYRISEIDQNVLSKLNGRIIPSFSWQTSESFLQRGKGFCFINNNDICCTAFSSGIGNGQIDIGVETAGPSCGKGLGTLIAAQMVEYSLKNGYEPAWGCDTKNVASAAIACKLGFERTGLCTVYMKA